MPVYPSSGSIENGPRVSHKLYAGVGGGELYFTFPDGVERWVLRTSGPPSGSRYIGGSDTAGYATLGSPLAFRAVGNIWGIISIMDAAGSVLRSVYYGVWPDSPPADGGTPPTDPEMPVSIAALPSPNYLYNMTFRQARAVAIAGTPVRRWGEHWWLQPSPVLTPQPAVWWRNLKDAARRVVLGTDITRDDALASDWTTAPWDTASVCDLDSRSRHPQFIPPILSIVASRAAPDAVEVTARLSDGTFGAYRLIYTLTAADGTRLEKVDALTAEGSVTKSFTSLAAPFLVGAVDVAVTAESVLPLPIWTATATARVPLLPAFDFAVIRYVWTLEGGTDLDTRTAIVDLDASVDGIDVGWSRAANVGAFLAWGGDNTSPGGSEAVLVDYPALIAAFPAATTIKIRLRANWYGTPGIGAISLQFETFAGGSMTPSGTDFSNSGGTGISSIDVARAITSHSASDVDGQDCGTLVFDVATRTANLISPP